ncbi:hypothetical protein [Ideonella margarita]|uniref:Capsule polysaccharide biosynthesis protein n=1 Tax=Ideonella margarita TaxID=2984191 RepID=A0ABU9BZK9_9BURK
MSLINKILRGAARVLARRPTDPRVAPLCAALQAEADRLPAPSENGPLLAVQGVEDPLFYGLFASLALALRDATGARTALLQVRAINGAIGNDWIARIARSLPLNWLVNRQWAAANHGLIGSVAYRSDSLSHPLGDAADWFRAGRLWRSLQACDDISGLRIDGVLVGDLVIDSFLRFRPSPRFDVTDPFVRHVLWQCLRDLRRAGAWFAKARPSMYLSSYSTYIEHGIAVRVALAHGVPVRVYGNFITFGKRLSTEDVFHTVDTSDYRRAFDARPDQAECLAEADRQLSVRLSGGIDTATSYMKVSAYADSGTAVPVEVNGAVVIFLHDFYDSPHVYGDLVFPDFWVWLDFTVKTLREAGIPFWVKPHPNQIALSSEVMKDLQREHPDLRLLSASITNAQLVRAGMRCGVTVYGTVAHELAYLGVPCISCARHPHHAFEFARTASTAAEYQSMLRTPGHCPLPQAEMKRQALAFYFMHNLNGDPELLALRRQFIAFWKSSNAEDAKPDSVRDGLAALRALPGWRDHLEILIKEFTSHAR